MIVINRLAQTREGEEEQRMTILIVLIDNHQSLKLGADCSVILFFSSLPNYQV
jgi:hypothetical protein